MSERRRLLNQFERAGRDMAELPDWVRMPKTAKPDPSVPLSAIRALVQQWRKRLQAESDECPDSELTLQRCVEELAALCPAPTEDQQPQG